MRVIMVQRLLRTYGEAHGVMPQELMFHMDGFAKISRTGLMGFTMGLSDLQGRFHPLALALTSRHQGPDVEKMVIALAAEVKRVCNVPFAPKWVMGDADDAQRNGIQQAFANLITKDDVGAVRAEMPEFLMCYYHVVACTDKKLLELGGSFKAKKAGDAASIEIARAKTMVHARIAEIHFADSKGQVDEAVAAALEDGYAGALLPEAFCGRTCVRPVQAAEADSRKARRSPLLRLRGKAFPDVPAILCGLALAMPSVVVASPTRVREDAIDQAQSPLPGVAGLSRKPLSRMESGDWKGQSEPIAINTEAMRTCRDGAKGDNGLDDIDAAAFAAAGAGEWWEDGDEVCAVRMLESRAEDAEQMINSLVRGILGLDEEDKEMEEDEDIESWAERVGPRDRAPTEGLQSYLARNLGDLGYRTAVCRTKFSQSGSRGGSHEFIVVKMDDEGDMYNRAHEIMIVDIHFREQFLIARPTMEYSMALYSLPRVLVGWPARLCATVDVMCACMLRSMHNARMHCPPWRTKDYMLRKWLSNRILVEEHPRPLAAVMSPRSYPRDHGMGISSASTTPIGSGRGSSTMGASNQRPIYRQHGWTETSYSRSTSGAGSGSSAPFHGDATGASGSVSEGGAREGGSASLLGDMLEEDGMGGEDATHERWMEVEVYMHEPRGGDEACEGEHGFRDYDNYMDEEDAYDGYDEEDDCEEGGEGDYSGAEEGEEDDEAGEGGEWQWTHVLQGPTPLHLGSLPDRQLGGCYGRGSRGYIGAVDRITELQLSRPRSFCGAAPMFGASGSMERGVGAGAPVCGFPDALGAGQVAFHGRGGNGSQHSDATQELSSCPMGGYDGMADAVDTDSLVYLGSCDGRGRPAGMVSAHNRAFWAGPSNWGDAVNVPVH
eukprot:jgi/Mesvir1/23221/Mv22678-RA.1